MKFSAANTIDLGSAFRAGSINDSAAALVEIGDGILDLTLRLTLYTISFHCFLHFVEVYEHFSCLILPPVFSGFFGIQDIKNVTPPRGRKAGDILERCISWRFYENFCIFDFRVIKEQFIPLLLILLPRPYNNLRF